MRASVPDRAHLVLLRQLGPVVLSGNTLVVRLADSLEREVYRRIPGTDTYERIPPRPFGPLATGG